MSAYVTGQLGGWVARWPGGRVAGGRVAGWPGGLVAGWQAPEILLLPFSFPDSFLQISPSIYPFYLPAPAVSLSRLDSGCSVPY